MSVDDQQNRVLAPVQQGDGSPQGKGVSGLLSDWQTTLPLQVTAKPKRQILAELFTSMLVLSSSFRYRPAQGTDNYLYWINQQWSLSLIGPEEWSEQRRRAFVGTCTLQPDMTWTIAPAEALKDDDDALTEIRNLYAAFADSLD